MKNGFLTPGIFFLLFYFFSCSTSKTDTATQNEIISAPEVRSVFINGDSIHYIDIGKGDPVVFVHGSLGDYRTWGGQMDTFSLNHRVIAYSRRYAFPNDQTIKDSADYSVTPHAKDLVELLKALNLGPVHLVGHSYGASTTLSTTLEHPELVRSLTLGEPPVVTLLQNVPGGDSMLNDFVTKAMLPAAEAFKNGQDEKAVNTFIAAVMGDSLYYSRIPERDRGVIMQNTLESKGTVVTKNPFPPVSCDDLKKIKVPVLLVKGEKSPQFFISIINELERCLTNRETTTVGNASHGMEFENPAEFNKSVLGFIDRH